MLLAMFVLLHDPFFFNMVGVRTPMKERQQGLGWRRVAGMTGMTVQLQEGRHSLPASAVLIIELNFTPNPKIKLENC